MTDHKLLVKAQCALTAEYRLVRDAFERGEVDEDVLARAWETYRAASAAIGEEIERDHVMPAVS